MLTGDPTRSAQAVPDVDSAPDGSPRSILLVTPGWTRDGGVGAHVMRSAEALARTGMRVQVVAGRVDSPGDLPGVTVHENRELFDSSVHIDRRLGDLLSIQADVIHLHQIDDPKIADALQARAPLVISVHGYTACTSGVYYFQPGQECTRGHGVGCIPNLMARGCAHTRYPKTLPLKFRNATRALAVLRRADLAVSYSSSVDRHLAANGIAPRTLVPYFPTTSPAPPTATPDRRRVLFAGRIVRPKGVDVLIRAAPDVDAEFVLCGDGRELGEMHALAEDLGVQERVRFKGWLGADELGNELAGASVVVVPSVWPEPFGIVGIEALAAGRPVVGSATGGIGDWLEDGVTGLLVAPADAPALARALNELLEDPQRRSAMGRAGEQMVAERFSRERHLAALLAGYRSAVATWRSSRHGLRVG